MDDAEAIKYDGNVIATWKLSKPGKKFDDNAFAIDHPDLYQKYVKETQGTRRFMLK